MVNQDKKKNIFIATKSDMGIGHICNRNSVLYVLILTAIAVSVGCRQPVNDGARKAYLEGIYKQADSLCEVSLQLTEVQGFLDSVYNRLNKPTVAERYRKYEYLQACFARKNQQDSQVYTDSILWLLQDKTDDKQWASVYGMALLAKGDALFRQKEYETAFHYYYQGRLLKQQVPEACYFGSIYSGRMGGLKYDQGKYQQAIVYFKESISGISACIEVFDFSTFSHYLMQLNNIGLSYQRLKNPDSTFHYFDRAISLAEEQKDFSPEHTSELESIKALLYGNMSAAYLMCGDTATAERMLQKDIAISTRSGTNPGSAQNALASLIELYLETGLYDKTAWALTELRRWLDANAHYPQPELNWHKLRWKFLDQTGQITEAYKSLQSYIAFRDSLAGQTAGLNNLSIDKEFQKLEQDHAITRLKKASETKSIYLIVFGVIAILTAIILILLSRNARRSKQHIQELQSLNEKIRTQNESLEKNQRAISRILKVVAHDLRNPIHGILGFTSLMLHDRKENDGEREMIELIQASSRHSLQLIDELMMVDLERQRTDTARPLTDLRQLLTNCVSLMQFNANEKQQYIELNAPYPVIAPLHPDRLWRAINNLIGNAIKFSPMGKKIYVSLEQTAESTVRISVSDEGIGIPEEIRDQIFEAFTKAKRQGTSGEQSFGLGLSITRQIVEEHDGHIWLESTEGSGTTFFIELPLVR